MMPIQRSNPDGLLHNNIFSQVVTVSDSKLLFTAGQVAWDDKAQLIGEGDFRLQTQKCLENIDTILKSHDANWANVVKLTTFIAQYDVNAHRPVFLDVLKQFADADHLPASSLLGVQSLATPELMIEIEAIIALDNA